MPAAIDCAHCGHANPAGVRFCAACGASAAAQVHCPTCNQLNPLGDRFCTGCGAPLGEASWGREPADGAVVDGVWERGPEEFIRRVEPEDTRTFLGSRVVRVPPGTVGVVVVDGVVERVLPPGERTTQTLFERVAGFFTRRDDRTAFFLVDLRPIPVPFVVTTRPSAAGRVVQTQVLVSCALRRGDKEALGSFIANVLGDRPSFGARDLHDLLRPEVVRVTQLALERLAGQGELAYAEVEAELRRVLGEALGPRYGMGLDVTVAPLTTTASLSFLLGAGQAPRVRPCVACGHELPAAMRFCDACGERQPTVLSPDRTCGGCGAQVAEADRFCQGCGAEWAAPPATAAPLFTRDGQQVELDLVVRVQGQHQDFAPEHIAPALVAAAAAHLRGVDFAGLASGDGFSAMEGAVKDGIAQALSSYGLLLVSLSVLDVRSKGGQWLLAARADLERARQDLTLGRQWLTQRADELDLAELTMAQRLDQQRRERAGRLQEVALELAAGRREAALRADDAFARDEQALADRRRREGLSGGQAELDVAGARREAERAVGVATAQREVERDEREARHAREEAEAAHQMACEQAAFAHEAELTRGAMDLDGERRRQATALETEADRARRDAAYDDHERRARLEEALKASEEQRQADKLRLMAELDRAMAAQDHAHAERMREQLRGLDARAMIAMQATELSRAEGGGAAWAQALSSAERVDDAERHGTEVRELMERQAAQMQSMMTDQLGRMQAMSERMIDAATTRGGNAAAAEVYERSMDAMSRVAASRAAPAPVAPAVMAAAASKPCVSCGAELRADARFCGVCGGAQ